MSGHSRSLAAALFVVAVTALTGAFSSAWGAPGPARGTSAAFMEPTTLSPNCGSGARTGAACNVIQRFFRDVNSGSYAAACDLLGAKLRAESHGMSCEQFVEAGAPEPLPWGILDARATTHGVVVGVSLGQSELGHFRMRRHRAFVAVQQGRLRILATKLVA